MRNVEFSVEGNQLTVRIDLSKRLGKSKSGKTMLVATTGGNIVVAEGIRFGCTAYHPVEEDRQSAAAPTPAAKTPPRKR